MRSPVPTSHHRGRVDGISPIEAWSQACEPRPGSPVAIVPRHLSSSRCGRCCRLQSATAVDVQDVRHSSSESYRWSRKDLVARTRSRHEQTHRCSGIVFEPSRGVLLVERWGLASGAVGSCRGSRPPLPPPANRAQRAQSRHGLDAADQRPRLASPAVQPGLVVLTISASSATVLSEIPLVSDPLQQFESSQLLWIRKIGEVTTGVMILRWFQRSRSSTDFRVGGWLPPLLTQDSVG